MTQQPDLTEWDEDVTASTEDEYAALLRAIRWAQGFSLLFVQCSPAEGERLIMRAQGDVTGKVIGVLRLEEEIDDLLERIQSFPHINNTNILFITGLEKSLVSYIQPGFGSEGAYYAKDTVPKLLGKLNLQRERFKQDFAVCFVFLVPRYAMKYLIRRAADFFDWRSGVWEFVPPVEEQKQFAQRILQEGDYTKYLSWTLRRRLQRVQEINDLLADSETLETEASSLYREKGNILLANGNYEVAIAAYDASLANKPDYYAFCNKGIALGNLGRHEESIAAFDAALKIQPDYHAFCNKGIALGNLGRYEESIAAFDAALKIQPDYHAFYNKGIALGNLGRHEESIAAFDAALKIQPDSHAALYGKGIALSNLGHHGESIAAYDTALKIQPDFHDALYGKGIALCSLGCYEEAIAVYDAVLVSSNFNSHAVLCGKGWAQMSLGFCEEAVATFDAVLAINSDDPLVLNNKGFALTNLGRYEEAIAVFDAALAVKPDEQLLLHNKNFALASHLKHFEDAILASDAALAIKLSDASMKPEDFSVLNNKGIALTNLGRYEEAIAVFDTALDIQPSYQLARLNRQVALEALEKGKKGANTHFN